MLHPLPGHLVHLLDARRQARSGGRFRRGRSPERLGQKKLDRLQARTNIRGGSSTRERVPQPPQVTVAQRVVVADSAASSSER